MLARTEPTGPLGSAALSRAPSRTWEGDLYERFGTPGATSAARNEPTRHEGWSGFEENIGAVDIEFTPDDLRDIDSAAKIMIHGARCPEHLERRTNL